MIPNELNFHKDIIHNTLKVFISYSKKDIAYKGELETHLTALRREGLISSWSDCELLPGEDWDIRIKRELQEAHIILLLVSSDYLATDYIWTVELEQALIRHEKGEVDVVPIILRPCMWESAPFARLTALPHKGKPISNYREKDEAWTEICQQLRSLCIKIQNK